MTDQSLTSGSDQDNDSDSERNSPQITTSFAQHLHSDIRLNPLHEIATTAAILGVLFGISTTALFLTSLKSPSLYVMALSLFHFLEYYVTAKYNPTKVHKESFIINNGPAYTIAHMSAILEMCIERYIFRGWKLSYIGVKITGAVMVAVGQYIRFLAMKTAGESFNHYVQSKKAENHRLVTSGIYSVFRHPSYFGFYCWAIGTQLLLLNPVGLVGFAITLWIFFSGRIFYEEEYLIKFFGDDYVEYKKRTKVWIPFIN